MWDALQSCTKLNTYSLKTEQCEVGEGSYIQVNTKLQLPILCLSILWKYQQLESKKTIDSSTPAHQTAYYNDSELQVFQYTHNKTCAASAPTTVQATCDMYSLNQVISCVQYHA